MSDLPKGADGPNRASAGQTLAACRDAIEHIDGELIVLLARRVEQSREIGRLKRAAGLPMLDPKREAEVIRRAGAVARGLGLNEEPVRDIFWHVIGLSRSAQLD